MKVRELQQVLETMNQDLQVVLLHQVGSEDVKASGLITVTTARLNQGDLPGLFAVIVDESTRVRQPLPLPLPEIQQSQLPEEPLELQPETN